MLCALIGLKGHWPLIIVFMENNHFFFLMRIIRPRVSPQSVTCQSKYGNEHEFTLTAIQKSVCMKETVVFVTNSDVGARVDGMKWRRIVFTSNFVTQLKHTF